MPNQKTRSTFPLSSVRKSFRVLVVFLKQAYRTHGRTRFVGYARSRTLFSSTRPNHARSNMVVPPEMRIRPVGNYGLWGDFGRGYTVRTGAFCNCSLAIMTGVFSSNENARSVVVSNVRFSNNPAPRNSWELVFFFFPRRRALPRPSKWRNDPASVAKHSSTAGGPVVLAVVRTLEISRIRTSSSPLFGSREQLL